MDLLKQSIIAIDESAAAEKAKRDLQEKEIAMFWKLLPTVLQRAAPGSTLQDIARLEYQVKDTIHPADWTDADNLVRNKPYTLNRPMHSDGI